MNKKLIVFSLSMVLFACIGWSDQQKEVFESYSSIQKNAVDENWNDLSRGISNGSKQLLDEIAELYTAAGVPFENQGEKLLASLVSETNVLPLSKTVISIDFKNGKAYLLSGHGNQITSYEFVSEDQCWKLNLVPLLDHFMEGVMEGIPETNSSTAASPASVSTGTGPCELTLRNALEHLSIWNVYCSLSSSDSWGEDLLDSSILGTGAEMNIRLEEGVYDIRLVDSKENSYTFTQIELNNQGLVWQVTDLDRDEPN